MMYEVTLYCKKMILHSDRMTADEAIAYLGWKLKEVRHDGWLITSYTLEAC